MESIAASKDFSATNYAHNPPEIILVDTVAAGAGVTVTMPNGTGVLAQPENAYNRIIVKDQTGAAAANNITVIPNNSPAITIEGAASEVINTNYGAVEYLWDIVNDQWIVLSRHP